MSFYFTGSFEHSVPQACLVDLTAPIFAGIASLTPQVTGALLASWLAGTDPTAPVRYRIFMKKGNSSGLFSPANALFETRSLSARIYEDAQGASLVKDEIYFVGVRAVDGAGNEETNVVVLSAASSGVVSQEIADILNQIENLVSQTCGTLKGTVTSENKIVGVLSPETDLTAKIKC